MNTGLHISVGIEKVGINYDDCERIYRGLAEEADRDIARLQEMKNELTCQVVANVLGIWDFPEHKLNEKVNSGWAIGYFKKRINEAYGSLAFWATIAKKDVSEVEYIKDRFLDRLENVLRSCED